MKFLDKEGKKHDTCYGAYVSYYKKNYLEYAWVEHCGHMIIVGTLLAYKGIKSIIK